MLTSTDENPRIIVTEGNTSRTVPLSGFPFSIGRDAASHLCVPHPVVSRSHAVICRDEEGYFIEDLGSRYGVLLNGSRVENMARLRSGDSLQLGAPGLVLRFVVDDHATSARTFLHRLSSSASNAGSDIEKLTLFLQAAKSLNDSRLQADVLSTMLEYTIRLTCAERGFVFLGDSASTLRCECGRTKDGVPLSEAEGISHSIVRDAANSGSSYIVGDTARDALAFDRKSILAHDLRSVIAIPLWNQRHENLLGMLYLDSRLQTCNLSAVSQDVLSAISREAAVLVENANMVQAEQMAQMLRKELEIAASIQQSISPRVLPEFAGINLQARVVQCTEVGGDFYDIIPTPNGVVAVVADVSGKGMAAAILASIIQGMIYAQISTGISLIDCITAVNSFLCSRVSGQKYATLAALSFQKDGRVQIVNGGHVPPVFLMPDGSSQILQDGDVPVGFFADARFHTIDVPFPPGARIALLSDGISEAENRQGREFGVDEIPRFLAAPDPVEAIFSAVDVFCQGLPQHDDRTLLTLERLT